ncbi:MAG: NADH-quinone oxidoreductase subunit B family protein [Candidatus Baltobacteraceae bacterium]
MSGKFARSLGIRHLVCGSCNGCELEMNALAAPQYDISQEGWSVVASPRHADVVTVTGPMSEAMRVAAQRTIEAASDPVVLVAVGDCATGDGVWCGAGSAGPGAGQELHASIEIPGCPPSPDALREGLRAAATLLDGRKS